MRIQKTMTAMLAVGTFVGVAHAQSSVTLYGVADEGIVFNNNVKGGKTYSMASGTSSRWGLTGVEDLGAGLKAIFTLESGYTLGTGSLGQGGLEFGRRSFVGLASSKYGTLTFGRQYTVSNDATGFIPSGGSWAASGLNYGTRAADVDNTNTSNRAQNAIKYTSPSYLGITSAFLYSLGGQPGQFTRNEVIDAAVSYSSAALKLGVTYMFTKDPYYATYGDQGNSSTPTSATGGNNNMPSPIFGGYASAGSQQIITAGGTYVVGATTIALLYSNTQFQNLGQVKALGSLGTKYSGGTAAFNSGELGVKYALTPALTVAGAYIYTHNSGADGRGSARYDQINVGTIYSLSKLTSLYAIGFFETASGVDSTGKKAVANFTGSTYSSNARATAAIVGFTHKF